MGVKLKKQKLAHLKTNYLYSHDIYHMQNSKQSTPPPLKKQTKKKKEEKEQQQKTNVGNVIVYSLHCT